MGIFRNILLGHFGQVLGRIELNPTSLLQQGVGAGRIRGVVRHGDGVPVGKLFQIVLAAGIEAGRHGRDRRQRHQMAFLLLVEVFHIGRMLFHVEVDFALVQDHVGLEQVGHILACDLVAFLLQDGLDGLFKELAVRALGFAEGQLFFIRRLLRAAAAARRQRREHQDPGQQGHPLFSAEFHNQHLFRKFDKLRDRCPC